MSAVPEATPKAKHPMAQMFATAIPFVGRSGLDIEELTPGHVRAKMPAKGNGNHVQIMYAGALFTLAEIGGAALISSVVDVSKAKVVVKDLSIDFQKAFKAGEDAYFDATAPAGLKEQIMGDLEKNGKTTYLLPINLTSADGEVRATAKINYHFKKVGG